MSHETLIKVKGRELFECPADKYVPGCYTQRAYNLYMRTAFQETGEVLAKKLGKLGREKTPEELTKQFKTSYRTEYGEAWQRFIDAVQLKKFESLRDATAKLKVLTASESAFRDLFKGIWEGRRLDMEGEIFFDVKDERKWVDDALKALEELQRSLAKILETTEPGKRFINSPEGALKELSFLFVKAKGDIEAAVKAIPEPLLQPSAVRVLTRALQSTLDALLAESQAEAEALWKTTVYENFTKNPRRQVPRSMEAAAEAPIRSFSEVFNPKNGVFWEAVKKLQRLKDGFKFENHTLVEFSTEYQECVKKGEQLRDGLYAKDAEQVSVTQEVTLGQRGGVAEVWFYTNKDKKFSSKDDPDARGTILWTEAAPRGTKVEIRHDDNQHTFLETYADMDWGLFRLFTAGKLATTDGKQFACTWEFPVTISGNKEIRKADCNFQVKDKLTPFAPDFFVGFKCPEKLAP